MQSDLDTLRDKRARRGAPEEEMTAGGARAALVVAAVVIVVLQNFVPFGRQLLYPFTLLGTWVHEMGHGVTALLCGGRFERLDIYRDASGMAYSAVVPGFRQALVAAGGLIAPALIGALLLVLARRASRAVLWVIGAALLASLVLWIRTPVGWLTIGGLAMLFVSLARFGGTDLRLFAVQLVGLLLALDTVTRMDYFFVSSGKVGGAVHPSDVSAIAGVLGGPYQLWGGLCAAVAVTMLLIGLRAVLRGGSARPASSTL